MKHIFVLFAFACIGLAAAGQTDFDYRRDFEKVLAKTHKPGSDLHYDKLLARFRASDPTLTDFEVLALLIGYTDNPHYRSAFNTSIIMRLANLYANGQHAKTVALCDSFLADVPVHSYAITQKCIAFSELGMADSAAHYKWQFNALMTAIMASGSGKDPATGFFALLPIDAYVLVELFSGGKYGSERFAADALGNMVQVVEFTLPQAPGDTVAATMYLQAQHMPRKQPAQD